MNKDNKKMTLIRIYNFSDEANNAISKALYYANSEGCAKLNTVHLFLALIEQTEFGKQILDYMCASFDMLYSSYQTLASNGAYGKMKKGVEIESPEDFDREIMEIIATLSTLSIVSRQEISAEELFNNVLEYKSDILIKYLDYIGFSIEDLEKIRYSSFFIPEELENFVEDLNASLSEKPMQVSHVDNYIDEMVEILSRKLKANPCLVGEAGVGKTSIVYGLVNRILSGNVPNEFKDKHIVYINSALLTSGTRYRGDFEERMQLLMDWASKVDVILFLDEIHTFINLGKNGDSSADTAGNMIKKYLSDGTIHIIGATTLKEYHQYIEKDSAFSRRLQEVNIKEPSIDKAIDMIKNTKDSYCEFHSVEISDEIIELAVKLSNRYIKDKYLPDKAYTIIDQACAKVKLQGKKELNNEDILSIVSKISQVDINKLSVNQAKQLLTLEDTISKNLIGQKDAVSTVCKAIRRAKAGVREPNKPLASFLYVGPTGVGKTELCKVLSKEVAIGDAPLIKVDMSEYSEKHSISKMIGSAPGYVGYGEGGQLTEKVKHNPYSLILFDEIEKAHPEVFNIFLQLLDEGCLTDAEGNKVDFTNCILVMTSNAGYGADGMAKGSLGFGSSTIEKSNKEKEKIALKALEDTFKPEFLNRLDNIVIFDKLSKEQCMCITKLLLNKLSTRLLDKGINIKFNTSVVEHITEHGYSDKYGARNIRREIQDTVEDKLADAILSGELTDGCKASVSWTKSGLSIKLNK